MGEDEHVLEPVGRPRRPALWIGAWVVGLVVVVVVAVAGRGVPAGDPAAVLAALPAISAAPIALATAVPRPIPTLGDDGLVGGTVYSSPVPVDWWERSARADGR